MARTYGLSEKRIKQILKVRKIPRRAYKKLTDKQAISQVHVRIGLCLYTYRMDHGIELFEAANDLERSMIRIRKIEKGTSPIELLDLIDIASYTGTTVSELLREGS